MELHALSDNLVSFTILALEEETGIENLFLIVILGLDLFYSNKKP